MNLRLTRLLAFAVAVLAAGALAVTVHADTVVEEIVARINNDVITKSDLERGRMQLRQEGKQANANEQAIAEQENDLLRDMIDQQLLVQRGRDLGITADAELIKRLDEIRKNAGLSSLEELEQAAQQQGVNFEDWKQTMRNQIITREVIAREVSGKLSVGPDELQRVYEQNKARLTRPETIRLSEILIPTERPGPDSTPEKPTTIPMGDADVAQQKIAAEKALALIRSGSSFEEVAKQASAGATAAQGGDIGEFRRGTLAKELEQKTFDEMKAGDVSDIIRTRQGFVILKVSEHKTPGVPAYKDVARQVEEGLYMQKLQPALRAYLTKLREESYIVVKEGYVDSGASPNQTIPVVSTGPMPGDKKQKEESRRFYCLWLCKS
jgi:peptidyl-prolyl cis-trans isomerase SurA